jgi:hypothetical protein
LSWGSKRSSRVVVSPAARSMAVKPSGPPSNASNRLAAGLSLMVCVASASATMVMLGDGAWRNVQADPIMAVPLSPLCTQSLVEQLRHPDDLRTQCLLRFYRSQDWLQQGRLALPFDLAVDVGGYWLTRLLSKEATPAMLAFRAWLLAVV